jgi:hypothetical protein
MENQTQVVKGVSDVELNKARANVGAAVGKAYGAMVSYALLLNDKFGTFDWFNIEAKDTSEAAKPVHAEKGELFKVLKDAKHSNPSTIWARVRKYAQEARYPKAEGAAGGEGEGEGEGAGNGAGNRPRSAMLRNVEELTELYKFNGRQTALPEKVKAAQVHITAALKALGVDVSALG